MRIAPSAAPFPALGKAIEDMLTTRREAGQSIWASGEARCLAAAHPDSGLNVDEGKELILQAALSAQVPIIADRGLGSAGESDAQGSVSGPSETVVLEGTGIVIGPRLRLADISYSLSVFPSPVSARLLAKGELSGDP